MISINNVNKSYDNLLVLEDVNASIKKGTILGLVGKNGSGKSTLLRMIAGIIEPDAGVISIDHESIFDNPDTKQLVFFVSDDPYYFSQSTIQNMREFYQAFYKNFDLGLYHELLDSFEFSETTPMNRLSKGMKRQISLILGFSSKPDYLLLDEAFDGLDPIVRFRFKQLMGSLILDEACTIIISSHNLRELEDICDTVAFIDNRCVSLNQDTGSLNNLYHKYQVAFKDIIDPTCFDALNPLSVSGSKQLFTIIVKGQKEDIETKLDLLHPFLIERNHVTLEEIFVYEMEATHHE